MSDDPVEHYISQCSQPAQKWIRDHIDWVKDPAKYEKVQRAHFHAIGEGLKEDSPEYFAHVEKRIGIGKPEVVLTKRQAEAATDGTIVHNYGPKKGQPVGTDEYARRVLAFQREGRYDRRD